MNSQFKKPILLPVSALYAILLPMTTLVRILPYLQLILSLVLIIAILLQQTGAGAGGAFGGGDGSGSYYTRRGFEKFLFYLSIVTGVLLAASALVAVSLS